MSDTMNSIRYPNIGAFELKRTYQRNMMIAVMAVATVWALCIAAVGLTQATPVVLPVGEKDKTQFEIDLSAVPPPSVIDDPIPTAAPAEAPPPFVLPVASDDPLAGTEFRLLDPAVYTRIAPPGLKHGSELGGYYVATAKEEIPSPSVFVHAEKQPQPRELPPAHYPEMARKAGMEGTVQIQVYVGADGRVKKVLVAKESGSEIGFEEAAIEAAWLGVWFPAEQNGKPVGLWVSYPVRFRLNR